MSLIRGIWWIALFVMFALAANDQDKITELGPPLAAPYVANLWFNGWGLAAGLYIGLITANPFNWAHYIGWKGGWRMAVGLFALAIMIGRPAVEPLSDLFGELAYTPPLFVLGCAVLTPLAMLLGSILTLALMGWAVFAFGGFILFPMRALFEFLNNLETQRQIIRFERQGLASYFLRFGYWLRGEPVPDVEDDSKGARFASPSEIASVWNKDGTAFGHVGGQPLFLHTDKHILIMASTRSGKGVSLIIPHLLRYEGSAFVLDPKGENAKATGRQRAKLNRKVHYLDPFGISGKPRSRFNPLSRFTPANMEAESKALAAAMILGERDHWTASAQQLLAAIILFVYVSKDVPPDKKDLPTVRRFLLGGTEKVLNAMLEHEGAGGLLADLAASFLNTPEKERGSIISTAQRETEILDNPFIAASLAASGQGAAVDFSTWHKETMTVYLCLSAPKFPTFNRWLRLVLTSALDEMTDTLNPPTPPVCFMLDELATLGHLAPVENAVGLAAGYGIQLFSVFQDVAQMRDLYKGRWASFIGNAGIRVVFNLDDYDTAQYWSKFIGGHVVESASRQENIYGLSQGQSYSETVRPLLSPDEIMLQFAAEKMLVLRQGSRPIIADRVPYFIDPDLKGLWDDPRKPPKAA